MFADHLLKNGVFEKVFRPEGQKITGNFCAGEIGSPLKNLG